jgi:hypothetical protein
MTDIIGIDELPIPHEDGSFVSERVSRIVEIIRDYDPGRKHNIQERIDAQNAAARIVKEKKRLEALEEQLEVATAILKSPKSKYIGPNGKVYT